MAQDPCVSQKSGLLDTRAVIEWGCNMVARHDSFHAMSIPIAPHVSRTK